jgi:hypothetical protein
MAARANRDLLVFVSAIILLFPRSIRPRVAVFMHRESLVSCPASILFCDAVRVAARFISYADQSERFGAYSDPTACSFRFPRHLLVLIAFCNACSTPA